MTSVLLRHRFDLDKSIRFVGDLKAKIRRHRKRAWYEANFPEVSRAFDGLKQLRASGGDARKFCGQNPRLNRLEESVQIRPVRQDSNGRQPIS